MAKRRNIMRLILIIVAVLLILVVIMYVVIENNMRPLVMSIAEARLRSIAAKAMNDAILKNIDEDLQYQDLVNIVLDNNGQPAMLQANTVRMNRLAAKTALTAQEYIAEIGNQGISVALGTVIGGQLFSGQGPPITVQVVPAGSVVSKFVSEFEGCGINQTRHRINLRLETTVRVVFSGGGQVVELVSETPIAESIIVGSVPNNFFNTGGADKLNLIPGSVVLP